MEIALVFAIGLGVVAVALGAVIVAVLLSLRSTVDTDRARIAESMRRLRAGLDTAFGRCEELAKQGSSTVAGIQGLCSTVEELRREVVSIGEDARSARREVTRLARPAAMPRGARPADEDGDATVFIGRPPANDGATVTDRAPITPTKLSPAPGPQSPKAR